MVHAFSFHDKNDLFKFLKSCGSRYEACGAKLASLAFELIFLFLAYIIIPRFFSRGLEVYIVEKELLSSHLPCLLPIRPKKRVLKKVLLNGPFA